MISTYKKVTAYELLLQCAEELGCEAPEYFNLCLKTEEGVDRWLDLNKELESLGLEEGDSVFFKIKYFKHPSYKLDDVSLQLFFVQTKQSILSGNFIVPERIALLLAAFQLQIFYGTYDPTASWLPGLASNLQEFLPADHLNTAAPEQWASRIVHYYQYLYDLTATEATYGYLSIARRVPACGAVLFPVLQGKLHVTMGIVEDGVIFFKDDKKSMFEFISFDDLLAWTNVEGGVALRVQKQNLAPGQENATAEIEYFQMRVSYDCSENQALSIIDLLEGYNWLLSRRSEERQRMLISEGLRPVAGPSWYFEPARRVQDEPFGSQLDHFLNAYRHTCNLEKVNSFAPLLSLVDRLDFPGKLTEIELENTGLDFANSTAIVHAIEQAQRYKSSVGDRNVTHNFELTHVNVARNRVSPTFVNVACVAPSITYLNLSGNSFAKDEGLALALSFKGLTSLVEFHLADAEISDKTLCACLPHLSKCLGLRVLDLSSNNIKGVNACTDLAKLVKGLQQFEKLILHHNKLSDSAVEAMVSVLDGTIAIPPPVTLSSNSLSSRRSAQLTPVSSIRPGYHLDLRHIGLSSKGLTALANYIKNHKQVRVLKIAGNALSSHTPLVEALKEDVQLLVLDVGEAGFGKKGWSELFNGLAHQTDASRFEASGGLDKHGWNALRMFMRDISMRISHFEFENCDITSQANIALADILSHTSCYVSSLVVKGAQFGKKDFAAFADALAGAHSLMNLDLSHSKVDNAAIAQFSAALKTNKSLVSVNLDHNQISDAATADLAEAIQVNTSLEHLSLRYNALTADCLSNWSSCISSNCTLQTIDLRNNNISLDLPTRALLRSVPCTADVLL